VLDEIQKIPRWSFGEMRQAFAWSLESRDVLLLTRVDKPALLRRLFELACRYSGQVLSYTKMLGQLHDAGNTTTLAHYLDLLFAAGLVCGLQKYAGDGARTDREFRGHLRGLGLPARRPARTCPRRYPI